MTVGLDTSVVLRLLVGTPDHQAQIALRWYREVKARKAILVISDLVISEIYFALQYHFNVPKAEALQTLARFLASDEIKCSGVAGDVLKTPGLATSKPGFVDRMIHQQYMQWGADEMITFETAAKKLHKSRILE